MFCDGDMTLGDWLWMTVLWLGLFGILAALLVSVFGSWRNRSDSDPRAIIDAMLARGEITVDEYRERRATLQEIQ